MIELEGQTRSDLEGLLVGWGAARVHANRLWRYMYQEGVTSPAMMVELPLHLRKQLEAETHWVPLTVQRENTSADGLTRKFLLQLPDGHRIETVLMRYRNRQTACLSSQVGCAYGCVFCATGQMGFVRHLSTAEIVAQVMLMQRVLTRGCTHARSMRLDNVVMMGMGEPLHNYDATLRALEILHEPGGFELRAKHLTLSTVGIVPGIIRLADERRPFSLAVSLHAATQEERERMLPVARVWPLKSLMDACRYYCQKLNKRIFFEWTLIAGTNDSPVHAAALARLLQGLPAHVNLIPLNPTRGYAGATGGTETIDAFKAVLGRCGVPSTVRQRRGVEIAGGCGQLATL